MANRKPISELSIAGFKSIKKLEKLRLSNLNVLIGANGAGKSNFVSYFRMLGELVEGRLQQWASSQGSADRVLTFGVKETTALSSFVKFGLNGYDFLLTPTVEGAFSFLRERVFYNGPYFGPKWIDLGTGHREAKLKEAYLTHSQNSEYDYCYSSIASWKIFHFHDTSDSAGVKRYGSLHDNKFLRSDASNLAAFLHKMSNESPEVFERIRRTIRLAIPIFDDFVLIPRPLQSQEEQINLQWRQVGSDYALWPSQLSDGSIRFICLVTALLQPNPPSTIIIDEPELGLHPFAITLLASLLRSASARMQIVVSTQSVPLVNEFEIDDLIVVERRDGSSAFENLDKERFQDWLTEYSTGELWEKNVLGGRPRS